MGALARSQLTRHSRLTACGGTLNSFVSHHHSAGPMRIAFWKSIATALLVACGATALAAAADPVERLLSALGPAPNFARRENAAVVLREFKAAGLIARKPERSDYTDYYLVLKPLRVFGHDLVLIEDEYMLKYVGCCVSEGAGLALRTNGGLGELEAFARKNKCQVQEFQSEAEYREFTHVRFKLPVGSYASLSCRARDEEQ